MLEKFTKLLANEKSVFSKNILSVAFSSESRLLVFLFVSVSSMSHLMLPFLA